jgi:predicted DNA-binding transcriptional regulator AlpA
MSARISLLEKSAVTQRLGICERTLENLVKAQKFPRGLKLGKNIVWDEVAVEKWLANALEPQLNWLPPQRPRKGARLG